MGLLSLLQEARPLKVSPRLVKTRAPSNPNPLQVEIAGSPQRLIESLKDGEEAWDMKTKRPARFGAFRDPQEVRDCATATLKPFELCGPEIIGDR